MPVPRILSIVPLLIACVAPSAWGQGRFEETGSFQFGAAAVWVRATDNGMVHLYASRGYRDAFARPAPVQAGALATWIERANEELAKPRRRVSGPAEPSMRSEPLGPAGTVLELYLTGDFTGVQIKTGSAAEGLVVRVPELSVGDLFDALGRAAALTREMTPPPRTIVAANSSAPSNGNGVAPSAVSTAPPSETATPRETVVARHTPPAPQAPAARELPPGREASASRELPAALEPPQASTREAARPRDTSRPREAAQAREAPVREAPVREAPVREAPVREAPVRDTPVRDTPVRDTSVRDSSVRDAAPVRTPPPARQEVAASAPANPAPSAPSPARAAKPPTPATVAASAPARADPVAPASTIATGEPAAAPTTVTSPPPAPRTAPAPASTTVASEPPAARTAPPAPNPRDSVRESQVREAEDFIALAMRAYAKSKVGDDGDGSEATTSVDTIRFENRPAPLSEEVERVRFTTNDPREVREFLREQQLHVELCYLDGLAIEPTMQGTLTISTRVGEAGRVHAASATRRKLSGAPAAKLERCVVSRVREWVFPAPGRDVTYLFTITFAPKGFE